MVRACESQTAQPSGTEPDYGANLKRREYSQANESGEYGGVGCSEERCQKIRARIAGFEGRP